MTAFLAFAAIHMIGLISPGPDFVMVTRNSLLFSRRIGALTAAGIAAGIAVHVSYSLLGIGLLISRSIMLFNTIKYFGAAYLIFIGLKAILKKEKLEESRGSTTVRDTLTGGKAFGMGFLTNVLNPKATLFILALFTQVMGPDMPLKTQLIYSLFMVLSTLIWFSFVALLLSLEPIQESFSRVRSRLDRLMGVMIYTLGLKILFAKRD